MINLQIDKSLRFGDLAVTVTLQFLESLKFGVSCSFMYTECFYKFTACFTECCFCIDLILCLFHMSNHKLT